MYITIQLGFADVPDGVELGDFSREIAEAVRAVAPIDYISAMSPKETRLDSVNLPPCIIGKSRQSITG